MSDSPADVPPPRTRRAAQSVTVHDVARAAGVSAMTVSRAVNTPERVPPRTLAAVRQAIEQTGYVPNMLAGGLRSNRSRLVAALIPTLISPVFSETVQALTQALRQRGYQLMLGQSGYGENGEDEMLDALIGRRPDGIVLTGVVHSAAARTRLRASGIPIVEIWDQTDDAIDMLVGFSHVEVSRAVCRFLHARGRRTLGMIGGDDERARRRSQAFLDEARVLGLATPLLHEVPAPTTLGSGREGLRSLLARQPALDAVFCSSDMLALGVLTEAQALGLALPAPLSVVGFGDLSFARDLHPALTTVRVDGTRIGEEAARCLVDRIEATDTERHAIDIGFSIIERDSA